VTNIFRKFISADYLKLAKNEHISLDSYEFHLTTNQLPLDKINIGSAAGDCLSDLYRLKKISDLQRLRFFKEIKDFYLKLSDLMIKTLPINNQILYSLSILDPHDKIRHKKETLLKKAKYLVQQTKSIFVADFVDRLEEEILIYYNDADTESLASSCERIDEFWFKIGKIKDWSGALQYPRLSEFAKTFLCITAGQAEIERGFFFNKELVSSSRSSLNIETISACRTTQSFIKNYHGSVDKMVVTSGLIKSAKAARKRYEEEQNKKSMERSESQSVKKKDTEKDKKKLMDKISKMRDEALQLLKTNDLDSVKKATNLLDEAKQLEQSLN
jgi:Zn-finger nucleic acid-binding protein